MEDHSWEDSSVSEYIIHFLLRAEDGRITERCPRIGHVIEHLGDDGETVAVDLVDESGDGVPRRAPDGYVRGLVIARRQVSTAGSGSYSIKLLRVPPGRQEGDYWWLTDEVGEFFMRTDANDPDDYPYAEMGMIFLSSLMTNPQDEADILLLRAAETEEIHAERGIEDEDGRADA